MLKMIDLTLLMLTLLLPFNYLFIIKEVDRLKHLSPFDLALLDSITKEVMVHLER